MPSGNGCQVFAGCSARRAFLVTYESAGAIGPQGQAMSGMQWTEGVCKGHASVRKDQIDQEGGKVVDVQVLPEPPAPPIWAPELEPVAVAVAAAPEPAPPAASPKRRRSRAKRGAKA